MKVALVKYRLKKYGKWLPKDRNEFKEIHLDTDSKMDKLDQVKSQMKREGINAVDIQIFKTETR